jgi:hypothetical protein
VASDPLPPHNSDTMFRSPLSWLVPLIGAGAVFVFVLLTTPPGFGALSDVLVGSARGPNADAGAYTLGAASSLALLTLVVLSALTGLLDLLRRR